MMTLAWFYDMVASSLILLNISHPACTCAARGKAIGFVCHQILLIVSTKIARSRNLGI
jgi:hypothetical protein